MTARRCEWCTRAIPSRMQSTARTCSQSCRQAKARFAVAQGGATPASGPLTFGYADPPYVGLARKLYGGAEVDHAKLVLRMTRAYPDGFALSCSRRSLKLVLGLVPEALDPRVCVWHKGPIPTVAYRELVAWEPVIVCGGRPRRRVAADAVTDVLVLATSSRQRLHPGSLVGQKPAGFWSWLFELLGATRGDRFEELFPGSGSGERAWRLFTGDQDATTRASRVDATPPRLDS